MKSALTPLLLFLGAILVCWVYQTPPPLGDDLNYWGLAFDLHHHVPGAWSTTSFHDLRWPIWGLIWLLQIPFGYGALSYYLEPMTYLGAGAIVVWLLALEVGATKRTAIIAGILFLFHPQLDFVIDRPMPDLSEGFWVAVAFLAWLKMVRSDRRAVKVALAATVGLALAIGQANRITGVFAIPVLFIATLCFYPRQFLWLIVSGAFAAGFVFIEAAVYHSLTGDWLHSLHANLGARGRKGTEEIPLWQLPVRFLPSLFNHVTDTIFNILALLGIAVASTRFGAPGRALSLYAIGYLLTYSCALQSVSPPRPLVRDGDRFLGSLAFPLAILTALALGWITIHLQRRFTGLRPRFAIVVALLVATLFALSTRAIRRTNYLREVSAYLETKPRGLKVLSHDAMRHVASLANAAAAAGIQWTLMKDLLDPSPTTLVLAAKTDEIWFNRKWIWTGTRKKSEYNELAGLGSIAPWLRPPLAGWTAERAIAKGDVPDFVFLRRSEVGITEQGPNGKLLRDLLLPALTLPRTWTFKKGSHESLDFPVLPIPPALAGRTLFLSLRYSSDTTEPARASVTFLHGDTELQTLVFKPYFFDESSEDFFFLTIPSDADTLHIRLRVSDKTTRITLDNLQLFMDKTQ